MFIPIEFQAFLSIPLPGLYCVLSSLSACQLEAEWYGGVWHYLVGPIHRFKPSISYNKVGLHHLNVIWTSTKAVIFIRFLYVLLGCKLRIYKITVLGFLP